jgi:hypothetical protein
VHAVAGESQASSHATSDFDWVPQMRAPSLEPQADPGR